MVDATSVDRVFVAQRDATGWPGRSSGTASTAASAFARLRRRPTSRPSTGWRRAAGERAGWAAGSPPRCPRPRGDRACRWIRSTLAEHRAGDGFRSALFLSQDRAVTARGRRGPGPRHPGHRQAVAVATAGTASPLRRPAGSVFVPATAPAGRAGRVRADPDAHHEITVRGPQPVDIYLRAVVRAEPYVLADHVRQAVEQVLGVLLSPTPGLRRAHLPQPARRRRAEPADRRFPDRHPVQPVPGRDGGRRRGDRAGAVRACLARLPAGHPGDPRGRAGPTSSATRPAGPAPSVLLGGGST